MRKPLPFLMLGLLLIGGCLPAPTTPEPPTPAPPTLSLPEVVFPTAAARLCREAIQLRLTPQLVAGNALPVEWGLLGENGGDPLAEGRWLPEEGELLVPFPQGRPLPPGAYRLLLAQGGTTLGEHHFRVMADAPRLTTFELSLTPDGPPLEESEALPHVLFVRYAFEAACPGAPLWITVNRSGEEFCRHNVTLERTEGNGAVSCYRPEGGPLEAGPYTAELTLMGEEAAQLTVRLGPEPRPEVPRYPVRCQAPFAALGLSPAGDPLQEDEAFEWYTQVMYVGVRCRNLPEGLTWEARWLHNGTEVRTHRSVWEGEAQGSGLLWDSLSGTEAAPFLIPGNYSVTFALEGIEPLIKSFRVIPYTPPETQTPEP